MILFYVYKGLNCTKKKAPEIQQKKKRKVIGKKLKRKKLIYSKSHMK